MKRYSFGQCPAEVITKACLKQCPNGYPMKIVDPNEWAAIAEVWNKGIDSHLEAITTRSTADNRTGKINIHPEELCTLLRRLYESDMYQDECWDLRTIILETLGIEEV